MNLSAINVINRTPRLSLYAKWELFQPWNLINLRRCKKTLLISTKHKQVAIARYCLVCRTNIVTEIIWKRGKDNTVRVISTFLLNTQFRAVITGREPRNFIRLPWKWPRATCFKNGRKVKHRKCGAVCFPGFPFCIYPATWNLSDRPATKS